MVASTFNVLGFRFQQSLRHIQLGYHNSKRALESELERTIDDAIGYQSAVEEGSIEWIGERDEDGHVIWSQADFDNAAVDDMNAAISALNKGFIPILYHHWERGARQWIKFHKSYNPKKYIGEHDALAEAVTRLGVAIDHDLKVLLTLNNALKHNNARYGRILADDAPGLIPGSYDPENPFSDLYEAIDVDERAIDHFIGVVGRSAPHDKTVFVTGED